MGKREGWGWGFNLSLGGVEIFSGTTHYTLMNKVFKFLRLVIMFPVIQMFIIILISL